MSVKEAIDAVELIESNNKLKIGMPHMVSLLQKQLELHRGIKLENGKCMICSKIFLSCIKKHSFNIKILWSNILGSLWKKEKINYHYPISTQYF